MVTNELQIGTLFYDCTINDFGIIIDCCMTKNNNPTFKYYLIHWQREDRFNINKETNYKWPAAHLHNRISMGEIVIIKNEKTKK